MIRSVWSKIKLFGAATGVVFRETKRVIKLKRNCKVITSSASSTTNYYGSNVKDKVLRYTTRREHELIRSNRAALKKFGIIFVLQIPPIVGYIFVIIALRFPKYMLSHHFWSAEQKELYYREEFENKDEVVHRQLRGGVTLGLMHRVLFPTCSSGRGSGSGSGSSGTGGVLSPSSEGYYLRSLSLSLKLFDSDMLFRDANRRWHREHAKKAGAGHEQGVQQEVQQEQGDAAGGEAGSDASPTSSVAAQARILTAPMLSRTRSLVDRAGELAFDRFERVRQGGAGVGTSNLLVPKFWLRKRLVRRAREVLLDDIYLVAGQMGVQDSDSEQGGGKADSGATEEGVSNAAEQYELTETAVQWFREVLGRCTAEEEAEVAVVAAAAARGVSLLTEDEVRLALLRRGQDPYPTTTSGDDAPLGVDAHGLRERLLVWLVARYAGWVTYAPLVPQEGTGAGTEEQATEAATEGQSEGALSVTQQLQHLKATVHAADSVEYRRLISAYLFDMVNSSIKSEVR